MDKGTLKQIIRANQAFVQQVRVLPRYYQLEEANYILVGMRRAGKTYLMYQYIQRLLQNGHSTEEILFVNFEDERIVDMPKTDLHLIIEAYQEMYEHEPIIFLDEIQNIAGWEHFARRLADEKRRVMITGSNARMLSREMATTLGGRFLVKEIFPFSFGEYLTYQQIHLDKNWEYGPEKAQVIRAFDNYLVQGGVSEVFGLQDKRGWLTSLYHKVLYSDIVLRNNIRNEKPLAMLVRKLADSLMQSTSVRRLQNILSAMGYKTAHETVGTYLEHLNNAYLLFAITNYAATAVEKESNKKYYFMDNGVLNLFLTTGDAKLLENLVAITLRRNEIEHLYYYQRNIEVDFLLPNSSTAIQVSWTLQDEATFEREVTALEKLNRFIPQQRNLIITYNEEQIIQRGDITIEVVPVWKWLLQNQLTILQSNIL